MIVYPNAKINLGLHVTQKRDDGYHELQTFFYPIGYSDILEIIESKQSQAPIVFHCSGIPIPGNWEENVCYRAWKMLAQEYQLPAVEMHLHKLLPNGAGLGGGSSDAAFTLRLLNDLFQCHLDAEKMEHMAAQIGSDCAFFIRNTPSFAYGRGELLQPSSISLKGYYLVLITPRIQVSTAEAYSGIRPQKPAMDLESILTKDISEWKDILVNDFEKHIFSKYPAIENLKHEMYRQGALYASMSGSGSSVYGIFKSNPYFEYQGNGFCWMGDLQ